MARTIVSAMADGTITSDEAADISRECDEAICRVGALARNGFRHDESSPVMKEFTPLQSLRIASSLVVGVLMMGAEGDTLALQIVVNLGGLLIAVIGAPPRLPNGERPMSVSTKALQKLREELEREMGAFKSAAHAR